jgi:hypothetical protein
VKKLCAGLWLFIFLSFSSPVNANICQIYSLMRSEIDIKAKPDSQILQTCEALSQLECSRMAILLLDSTLRIKKRWLDENQPNQSSLPLFANWSSEESGFDLSIKNHLDYFSLAYSKTFQNFQSEAKSFLDDAAALKDIDALYDHVDQFNTQFSNQMKTMRKDTDSMQWYLSQIYQDMEYLGWIIEEFNFLGPSCQNSKFESAAQKAQMLKGEMESNIETLKQYPKVYEKQMSQIQSEVENALWLSFANGIDEKNQSTLDALMGTLEAMKLARKVQNWWQSAIFNGLSERLETRYLQLTEAKKVLDQKLQIAKEYKLEVTTQMPDEVAFKKLLLDDIDGFIKKIEDAQQGVSQLKWQDIFEKQKSYNKKRFELLDKYTKSCLPALNNFERVAITVKTKTDFYAAEKAYKKTTDLCRSLR